MEISLNRIDNEDYPLICGIIGNVINELSYHDMVKQLPEISDIIGDAFVHELHVQGDCDVIEM